MALKYGIQRRTIECLENTDTASMDFDKVIWNTALESALVKNTDTIVYRFAGGREYKYPVHERRNPFAK